MEATESSQPQENTTMLESELERAQEAVINGKSPKMHKSTRIPKRCYGKSLGGMEGLVADIELARHMLLKENGSLLISGPCGTGKTHMAIGLLCEWYAGQMILAKDDVDFIYPKGDAVFLPVVELFYELKDTFKGGGVTENAVLKEYSEIDLLVLDDLGAEKTSDWSRQVFYLLLDRRYREMKQTIITTNLSLEQIAETFDDRVASRLCEMGVTIELKGKDKRVEK